MIVDAETGVKKLNKIRLKDATDRNDAVKAMYDFLKGIKDGEITSTKSAPDFKTFREHYSKVSGRARSSAIREDNCLKHWERFLGADFRISKITPRQILSYRGKLLERGLSPSTANHHVKALRAVLRLARTEKYFSKLPMDGITPLKVKSVERKLFSTVDILKMGTEALRSHPITGSQFADFLLVCMYSGGRKSEVAKCRM
jgi:site-specific recombinase XerD